LLKLDPKNTELLHQKQTVLNKSIETTQEKLKQLKQLKEKADIEMANGTEINEENYRSLQREIVATETKLSNLKNEASNWRKAGDGLIEFGNKLDKLATKVDNLGNKLSTRLTIPIMGAFAAATKEAIEFESAFTGVTKTVDGTEEQLESIKQGIRDLAKEIPSSTTEISEVAEAAGQLGIQTDNVLSFTKTMIDLGNATNLSADDAATTLARFANITQMSQSDFNRLGSVIVALGNNFATTESEIANMGMNLASAGKQVGMSQPQIMALATALSSVGLEAQAGGTAFSKVMVNMQLAVENGGKELRDFANVAGMSADEFAEAFQEDATTAIMAFVEGLSQSGERGESAIKVLDDMGITETRLRDALLRSANASDVMRNAIDLGNEAWDKNIALTEEANKRYSTTESQLQITKNKIKDVAVSIGNKLLPIVKKILEKVESWIDKFDKLSDAEKNNIIKVGLLVAALGPLLKLLSTGISVIGGFAKGIGTITKAISLAKNGIGDATGPTKILATMFQNLATPLGIAATGITTAVGIIINEIKKAEEKAKETFGAMSDGAKEFYEGIDNAKSHLGDFNTELFVSAQEQQELQEQMQEVQNGITEICRTASEERRDYTLEEIEQLDEYFQKLRELNQRELELEKAIAGAISQQATQNLQNFKGSLEEYTVTGQEWIKTAEDQKDKTIDLIEKQTIEEVALLNQRYGDEANMQNTAYATEYNAIEENKQKKIQQANDEVAQINSVFATGYLERSNLADVYSEKVQETNERIENENKQHSTNMDNINRKIYTEYVGNTNAKLDKERDLENEENRHKIRQKAIWTEMYENMDQSQLKQIGSLMAMAANTEMYGGKVDDKTKELINNILADFDKMPEGTKNIMKDAMQPMLDTMEQESPALYAKASNIADGILSRLKKSFDIHSPSRETRKIFENVMKGAELGLEDEEKQLNKEVDSITKKLQDKFTMLIPNMGDIKQSIVEKTQTIFTTPQIVFNVQELDEAKLQQCFNYINKKFGSAY